MSRLDWAPILNLATDIVRFYNTSITLGQLLSWLGSEQLCRTRTRPVRPCQLKTAALGHAGEFPGATFQGTDGFTRSTLLLPRSLVLAAVLVVGRGQGWRWRHRFATPIRRPCGRRHDVDTKRLKGTWLPAS
jgi:hypothetical protein